MDSATAPFLGTPPRHTVDSLLASIKYDRDRLQECAAFLKTSRARAFLDFINGISGEKVTTYFNQSGGHFYLSAYVKDLEGFKDQRLGAILTAVEYLSPKNTYMSESGAQMTKTFTYFFDNEITLTIEARVRDSSPTCRKVVVGFQKVEPQPIYKIECDEELTQEAVIEATAPSSHPIAHAADPLLAAELDELTRERARPILPPPESLPGFEDTKWENN